MTTPQPQDVPFQLWSASVNGATAEAEHLLAEAATRGEPAMVDLGHGEIYWGWHPLIARFIVGRKAENAPAALPAYLAQLVEASHVHAGGASAEEAVAALLGLVTAVVERLEAQEI